MQDLPSSDQKNYPYTKNNKIIRSISGQESNGVRKKERQLRLFAHIFDSVNEGIIVLDADKTMLFINSAFSTITGYSATDLIGKNLNLLNLGWIDNVFSHDTWRRIDEIGRWQGEVVGRRKNNESYAECLSISTIKNELGEASYYIGVFSDISERKAAEERVAYVVRHDPLTNLPNGLLLQDRLVQAIYQAGRENHKVAVMCLDLDHFKVVNDMLGHFVGDKLLQEISRRISSVFRASDTVSRRGGDEFVIILPDLKAVDAAAVIAAKLINVISDLCLIDGNEIKITTSIGISIFPEDGYDENSLIKYADAAMYHAKKNGRNNYQFFTNEMNQLALERMSIERKLRHALERQEFCLHYQPQVDLRSGHIIGVEALLRWNNLETGMIPPGLFIPIAEENGLIIPIGEWVLREACRQNSEWRMLGLPEITMAVNLSAVQFRQNNFGEMIQSILCEYDLDPSGLELEITEGVVMHNAEVSIALLLELKAMRLKLSVDDFGTGYSSLSYLKRFPIDKLKIDQSFVHDIDVDSDDAVIVSTIINMARTLKLKVIAEGVETAEQLSFLKHQGCDEIQGYYFSKPVPPEKISRLLASGHETNSQWSYELK
ncbi:putative bifunctional diguanylate cyclase/phosphodiesterase [Candidatus Nitrotoga sp. M5]|uniref:putative bifunctional diguanylate cyclase/phosphodiesterase n=1 Tax=Candidatus Nitrotoga sp. M5 TaxID=2890409 RepID=UPI001EF3E148|nr:EAL domain-containing protein [Candidatus Nitrotoga sp. M5]CAH1387809.1 PAS domain S-box-containing protein/diguanylate cyclase (GGDEF) domain-containing protein [Candidatus Nitrotoga sp. M5]